MKKIPAKLFQHVSGSYLHLYFQVYQKVLEFPIVVFFH